MKKIKREIDFIYFLIFANYFLTFFLYKHEFPNPINSIFTMVIGILTIVYGILIILTDFGRRK